MNNSISVSQVRTHAKEIKGYATNLNNVLGDVKKQMNTISNSWKSNSQQTYINNFNALKKKFEGFYKAVNDFGDTLNKVADIYEKYEQNVSKDAKKLAN